MFGCGPKYFIGRLKLGRVTKLYALRMNYISPTQNVLYQFTRRNFSLGELISVRGGEARGAAAPPCRKKR